MGVTGFSAGNLGPIQNKLDNAFMQSLLQVGNTMLNVKSPDSPDGLLPEKAKKKDGRKKQKSAGKKLKKADQMLSAGEESGSSDLTPEMEEQPKPRKNSRGNAGKKAAARKNSGLAAENGRFENADVKELQKAVLWAEILGEPVSRKRRRKRMERYAGLSKK